MHYVDFFRLNLSDSESADKTGNNGGSGGIFLGDRSAKKSAAEKQRPLKSHLIFVIRKRRRQRLCSDRFGRPFGQMIGSALDGSRNNAFDNVFLAGEVEDNDREDAQYDERHDRAVVGLAVASV